MLNYATTHLEYKVMSTAMVLVATGTIVHHQPWAARSMLLYYYFFLLFLSF